MKFSKISFIIGLLFFVGIYCIDRHYFGMLSFNVSEYDITECDHYKREVNDIFCEIGGPCPNTCDSLEDTSCLNRRIFWSYPHKKIDLRTIYGSYISKDSNSRVITILHTGSAKNSIEEYFLGPQCFEKK